MSCNDPGNTKVSSHYSRALEPEFMHEWAETVAPKLINLLRRRVSRAFPVLVYTGMSGISHAAHLSGELCQYEDFEFGQMFVRKDGESSHGRWCEGQLPRTEKPLCLIFVDDFVSTGRTFKHVIERTTHAATTNWGFKLSPTVVTCLYGYEATNRSGVKKHLPQAKVLCV